MKLYEYWAVQYRENPYLDHIEDKHLQQRARDIFTNITTLSNDSKVGVLPVDEEGKNWWILWTHIMMEIKIRFGTDYKNVLKKFVKGVHFPDPRDYTSKKAAKFISDNSININGCFFKYGKKKYLVDLLNYGTLKLSPASFYSDPSMNFSIRDDELKVKIYPNPHTFGFEFDKKIITNRDYGTNPHLKKITINTNTDYYVFCISNVLLPRLFYDFNADSVLVINNPTEFVKRLNSSFNNSIMDYQTIFSKVKYYDPILINSPELNPFISKHFRYAYEKEERYIGIPNNKTEKLSSLNISLGDLNEIAEIFTI